MTEPLKERERFSVKHLLAFRLVFCSVLCYLFLSCILAGCREQEENRTQKTFFSLKEEDGIWWFIKPDGAKFISIGINHIEPVLISSECNRNIYISKYGDDLIASDGTVNTYGTAAKRWMKDSIQQVQVWGFNSLGMHNPIPQEELPYVATFRPAIIDGWAGIDRKYPDPFDPEVKRKLDQQAKIWADSKRDNPLILGIAFNDMTIWRSVPGQLHQWIHQTMMLPSKAPGKQKWIDFLRNRYDSPAEVGTVYGVNAETWEQLSHQDFWPEPIDHQRSYKDELDYLPVLADAWYGLITQTIRTHDPNHLIFGDKLEGDRDLPLWLDPIIGKYFDVIFIQWYAYASDQIPRLRALNRTTGKPILMGDSSFSCPNHHVPHPKGIHVGSQSAVGGAYYNYLKTLLHEPYALGWHY